VDADRNREIVREIIQKGLNEGQLDIADQYMTDDYKVNAPGLDLPRGPDAFKKAIGLWRGAFSDFTMTIEELVAERDLVVNRFTTRGTHDGMLMGIRPTGKPIVVRGMECHRLADGKVVESWIGDDVPTILNQLGAFARVDPHSA
jgi:predicted ester cyclase